MKKLLLAMTALIGLVGTTASAHAYNADCPNGGTVRFGVESFEAAAKLVPIYGHIGDLLSKRLGCKVQVFITTNYSSEIEAMRAGKLEIGEFGALAYVLAHRVAQADAVAAFAGKDGTPSSYTASIVTWPGSGIQQLAQERGHTFAYSDPTSTSGHLFPAFALKSIGIDPSTGVKALYAGNHTATFLAIVNHKVQAGELSSEQVDAAEAVGIYKPSDFVVLWRSAPIPWDAITVRQGLSPEFKARLTHVLQTLDLSSLPPADLKVIASTGGRLVPQSDAAYDGVRALVKTLNINLAALNS
jgi:phosphonate transport system substrate-binding protein